MKPVKLVFLGVLFVTTAVFAAEHDHSKMNHAASVPSGLAYYNELSTKDEFKVIVSTQKPFANGNNEVKIVILNAEQKVDNAEVKIKFFMPEMPGMPYMEYETQAKWSNGEYRAFVNLAMNGTWQYQLKFRTSDKKVRSVKGSVNY